MRAGPDGSFRLTYCTNIHPSNGWWEVFANLRRYAPALRERLAPGEPFGIGLRLSGRESDELLARGDLLERFRSFLDEHGLYVFTLNGFPYGPFHGEPVKAAVHAPDWRDEERVWYTLRLVEILARLLPDGMDGGISTSPLSYKAWVDVQSTSTWEHLARQVTWVAEALVRVKEERDKLIHLDIEPEPEGLLESSAEVVRFYEDWLLPTGAPLLAESKGVPVEEARDLLLEHVRICFDTCHVAVAYEDPAEVLDRFARVGIRVGKVQISSALRVILPEKLSQRDDTARALLPFVESTYLHQVVQRNADGSFRRYADLVDALPEIRDPRADEWRIHFHVPIFVDRYRTFLSTQDDIRDVFVLLRERHFCDELEIETYTWDVLPPDLKKDLGDSIGREYKWVLDAFA